TTKAERIDGGYRFTGRKQFGSLTPVWTRFGMHGIDTSDPEHPNIVHAFVPDRYVARVVPAGGAGVDRFVLAVFAWALLGFGNVYYGLAQRAFDLTIAAVKKKRSAALTRSMAYHPEVQHAV